MSPLVTARMVSGAHAEAVCDTRLGNGKEGPGVSPAPPVRLPQKVKSVTFFAFGAAAFSCIGTPSIIS